jgi:hypothetical protein
MCCIYENITDLRSKLPNSELFIEHRHDQALLGIIAHKYNIPLVFFGTEYLQK